MGTIVRTRNLVKNFKGVEVVQNVNMNIQQGEIYGFLGPNGAGKTTVMKMLTNLVRPTSGEIEIFGQPLQGESFEVLRRMGSIIEYPVFYEKLTAVENLDLHCEYMGYYNKQAIRDSLDMVNLTNVHSKSVKDYSLGMKQRLGIARAILTKPEFLILDEPINGLDPLGIKEMRDIFKILSKEHGITILISSHILAEIEQIADTIGVIRGGRLLEEISMDVIRKQSTSYMELTISDSRQAARVLEHSLRISNYKVMDEKHIRIYEIVDAKDLTKRLVQEDVSIEGLSHYQNSLEDHFLQLIQGGESHV
ncbi:ABC-2 type transport system ATP-binding protein [Paenibacillus shirakamiensis]|uniref:ABC-2 type transport system ATP-binding protein n=1 Tax=Paenibacillus shirakamiensis TaxID=1265935 RepID=A0ABS4JIY2_9BACL|nr:ABC transporter ATP-binding protein [Paenibacillus shirakamiensis]MBP2001667.1 ABC-2 type transport system ATP-binding protein [Paenibacillus shirakamiensis]